VLGLLSAGGAVGELGPGCGQLLQCVSGFLHIRGLWFLGGEAGPVVEVQQAVGGARVGVRAGEHRAGMLCGGLRGPAGHPGAAGGILHRQPGGHDGIPWRADRAELLDGGAHPVLQHRQVRSSSTSP